MSDLLLISEAARILNVAPSTLRVWDAAGKLHPVRTSGGVRLFLRTEVLRMAAERAR